MRGRRLRPCATARLPCRRNPTSLPASTARSDVAAPLSDSLRSSRVHLARIATTLPRTGRTILRDSVRHLCSSRGAPYFNALSGQCPPQRACTTNVTFRSNCYVLNGDDYARHNGSRGDNHYGRFAQTERLVADSPPGGHQSHTRNATYQYHWSRL